MAKGVLQSCVDASRYSHGLKFILRICRILRSQRLSDAEKRESQRFVFVNTDNNTNDSSIALPSAFTARTTNPLTHNNGFAKPRPSQVKRQFAKKNLISTFCFPVNSPTQQAIFPQRRPTNRHHALSNPHPRAPRASFPSHLSGRLETHQPKGCRSLRGQEPGRRASDRFFLPAFPDGEFAYERMDSALDEDTAGFRAERSAGEKDQAN
jgi:hypothetical protein